MLGVLVVQRPDGSLASLRGFSGMLDGAWAQPGFVPPLFDLQARARIEVPGEAAVKALLRRAEEARGAPVLLRAREDLASLLARQQQAGEAMRARHAANRAARHSQRAAGGLDEAGLHALGQQSRADQAERRRFEAACALERLEPERKLRRGERRVEALGRLRRIFCRRLMRALHDLYEVPGAGVAPVPLRSLFPSGEPVTGAGECAAPKLLGWAHRAGLRPVALAEFWWGVPPSTGGRREGVFYPSCKDKCAPLLPHLLAGLEVAHAPVFRPTPFEKPGLAVLHEDAWVVVVDKPAGLLSVPGREEGLYDSVLVRLRERYPSARGPLLVHRLDLDTSGVLLAGLTPDAHAVLQAQFAARTVEKRYVAWVEGDVEGEGGLVSLALRGDPADRPRQVHDPVAGLEAVTEWKVLARGEGRTRVAFFPRTGRTHQLRVHASHPAGLGRAILGDRLYGLPGDRLMLHAERLTFTHPHTGERVTVESPAPF
jgi:tRNA pseudouridine32 synthase/23S rRNA pseudouridine746 synthase